MNKTTQQRQVKWRVSIIRHASEVTRNVAKTCRHFGISRQTFYKWIRRYKAHGETGLCDQPRRPHRSPNSTRKEVVSLSGHLKSGQTRSPENRLDEVAGLGRHEVTR